MDAELVSGPLVRCADVTGNDEAPELSAALVPVVEAARDFARSARSTRTREAYASQWKSFLRWCEAHVLEPMPVAPTTLALYLSARASGGAKVATLSQALAAIGEAHRLAGHEAPMRAPVVRETWKGIRRQLGTAQRQVRPLLASDVCNVVAALPATLRGMRDRALLTLGFAGAFRPSELGAIGVGDVAFVEDGLTVMLRRSKGDPEGAGETVGIPWGTSPDTCPVRAVRAWLAASAIEEGPLLRGVVHGRVRGALCRRDVAKIIKRLVALVGLPPEVFSGHSLRAGLATTAARAGKPDRAIMRQGRWRSRAMLDRYVRDATLFRDNAAAGLGL